MNDAAFRIANNPTSYRPVMTNHFEVTIFDLDGMINEADPDKKPIVDSALTLKIANDTFQEPSISQGTVDITKGNMSITFPGPIAAFSTTSSFHVFVNKSAYDILYSWKLASGNPETGDVGNPQDYWKRVEVDVMTGNKGQLVGTWTLNNCWISTLDGVTFANNSNEVKSVSVTLQYFQPSWRSQAVTY